MSNERSELLFFPFPLTNADGSESGYICKLFQSVSSDINASFALKIKTSRPIQDRLEMNHFQLVVDKLRGR
jgi:hypothetical protein